MGILKILLRKFSKNALRLQIGGFSLLLLALSACGKGGGVAPTTVAPKNPQQPGSTAYSQPVAVISKRCPGGGQVSITGQTSPASPSGLQIQGAPQLKLGDSITASGSGLAKCGSSHTALVPFQCQGRVTIEGNRGFSCDSGYVGATSAVAPVAPVAAPVVPQPGGGVSFGGALTGGRLLVYGNGQNVEVNLSFQSPYGQCVLLMLC